MKLKSLLDKEKPAAGKLAELGAYTQQRVVTNGCVEKVRANIQISAIHTRRTNTRGNQLSTRCSISLTDSSATCTS